MKKIVALVAFTAIFASCKKENVTNPQPQVTKRLKQIVYTDQGAAPETEKITYDSKGRISRYTTEVYSYDFSYESETRLVVTSKKASDNSLHVTNECTLNAKGAITEMLYKNPAGELTYTYQYSYDNNGQMTNVKGFGTSGNGYEMVAENINGDTRNITHYSDGLFNGTSAYYYEGAKTCKMPSTLAANWPSATLFGKSNTLLPTEYKRWNQSGTLTWHTKLVYEMDADGYVTKITTTYLDGTSSVETYQYE